VRSGLVGCFEQSAGPLCYLLLLNRATRSVIQSFGTFVDGASSVNAFNPFSYQVCVVMNFEHAVGSLGAGPPRELRNLRSAPVLLVLFVLLRGTPKPCCRSRRTVFRPMNLVRPRIPSRCLSPRIFGTCTTGC